MENRIRKMVAEMLGAMNDRLTGTTKEVRTQMATIEQFHLRLNEM